MHALLFQAATLGASGPKSRAPEKTGPGASAMASASTQSMTLVLVQLPGATHSDRWEAMLEGLASSGVAPVNGPIQVISPDPTPAFEAPAAEADASGEAPQAIGDPAVRSQLFGRYTGQIDARIERAWRKPRSAVTEKAAATSLAMLNEQVHSTENDADEVFQCLVRITQDIRGNVEEIELVRCNGTLAWQQSLVNAIQQASPLPAPPSPTVFTNALTLRFEGRPYAPGMVEEGYEPATYRLVQATPNVMVSPPAAPYAMVTPLDTGTVPSDPGLPFDAPVAPRTEPDF